MNYKIQINFRVTEELLKKIQAQAEKEHRSVNNMIEVMCIQYLINDQ